MRTSKKIALSAATLLGMFAGAVQADEPAIVRISDKAMPIPSTGPMPATLTAHESVVGNAEYGEGCDDGGSHSVCKHIYWPDHGFRRPVVTPIERDAIVYHRYWPNRFYGQPGWHMDRAGQFPMVYMPTDTTQLGFYYQRVPQWLPNPRMIPPPPRPADWHVRENPIGYQGGFAPDAVLMTKSAGPTLAKTVPSSMPAPVAVESQPMQSMAPPVPQSAQPIPAPPTDTKELPTSPSTN